MPTTLIDSNILVYAYDNRDVVKQSAARRIIARLGTTSSGFLSVKTLSEFFVVVRRNPALLSADEAITEVEEFAKAFPVLNLTTPIVLEAARGVRDYQFSYWDAQMWATAKLHTLNALFTENMNSGSVIDGVAILNPFVPTFDLEAWLTQ